jgi:hypothetical protein
MSELPPASTRPEEFFERWLPRAFERAQRPAEVQQVELDLGVRLEGEEGGEWLFRLQGGKLKVERGASEPAAFTLVQSVADWRGCLWEGRGGVFGRQAAALFQADATPETAAGAGRALGPAALSRLRALRGVVRMVVAGGPGGDWRLDLKLGPGPLPPQPTATVVVRAEDAAAMEQGELDPMQAFMAGRVQLAGDLGLLMRVQAAQRRAAPDSA